jgi:hypothetical protein
MGDMISPIGLRKKYQQKRLPKGVSTEEKTNKDWGALALTTPAVTTPLTLIPLPALLLD